MCAKRRLRRLLNEITNERTAARSGFPMDSASDSVFNVTTLQTAWARANDWRVAVKRNETTRS